MSHINSVSQPIIRHAYNFCLLAEDISGGTVSIDLEAGGTPLSTSVDLCDALGYINQECPLKKTDNGIFNVTQTIPGEAPTV